MKNTDKVPSADIRLRTEGWPGFDEDSYKKPYVDADGDIDLNTYKVESRTESGLRKIFTEKKWFLIILKVSQSNE
jgi:hypothetical protein